MQRQRKGETSKPSPGDTLPPTGPPLLILLILSQVHPLFSLKHHSRAAGVKELPPSPMAKFYPQIPRIEEEDWVPDTVL